MDFNDSLGLGKFSESAKEPILKLIEVCQNGIGKIYEPIHVKRMAKARAEEINLISSASSGNIILPIAYSNGNIEIDTTSTQELITRAQSRIWHQEVQKQHNIETIISHAYSALEEEKTVSKEPVDKDWTTRFFNIAGDISNDDLQVLWGKVLSGEIKEPGSYSLRTLDVLRNLSKKEAEAFTKVADYVLRDEDLFFIYDYIDIPENEALMFSDILILDEAGLIKQECLSYELNIDDNFTEVLILYGDNVILIRSKSQNQTELNVKLRCHVLTKAGIEIYSIVKKTFKEGYIRSIAEELKKQNAMVLISKVTSINEKDILYDKDKIIIL